MLSIFIWTVVWLIVAGVIVWAIKVIVDVLPIDVRFKLVIRVLCTVFVVLLVVFYVIVPLLQHIPHLR